MKRKVPLDELREHWYFTADLHLDHSNIIKFQKRPFSNVDHMNEMLILNWNTKVPNDPKSMVVIAGDFAYTRHEKFLQRLHGRKILVRGNHDEKLSGQAKGMYEAIYDLLDIRVKPGEVVPNLTVCHYAMRTWRSSHHGTWGLHGHSHGNLPRADHHGAPMNAHPQGITGSNSLDVGVDVHDYTPLSWKDIERILG